VYVRFDSAAAAANALRALNGRYFAGAPIAAQFVSVENYTSMFPSS
jgi:hypothetical protein